MTHDFTGPYNEAWRLQDKIAPADRVFAPCVEERNLNINTELRVTAGDSDAKSSFLAMESNYGNSRYQLSWETLRRVKSPSWREESGGGRTRCGNGAEPGRRYSFGRGRFLGRG